MALDTYDGLVETISMYLDRDDLTSLIPTFITLAELRINRALRAINMEATVKTPLVEGQVDYALPCDFLSARNIYIDTKAGNLAYVSPDLMSNINPALDLGYYTIVDGQIKINKTVEGNLVVEYFKRYPALGETNQSNWLTNYASDTLLYGSLIEAEAYLMTDERIPLWTEAFYKGIDDLNTSDADGRHSGDAMSIRAV